MFELKLPGTTDVLKFNHGHETMIGKILKDKGLLGYEPETLAACCAIIEDQKITHFSDIGANIGVFTVVLGKLFPKLGIEAFEPLPMLNEIATALCADNEVRAKVRGEALSNYEGIATLHISAKSDSSNSLNPRFRPNKGVLEVPVVTLDGLSAREDFFPRMIKIDTESTEPDIIEGGGDFIQRTRPWIFCEVLAGRTEEKLDKFISKYEYSPYSLNNCQFNLQKKVTGDTTYQYRDWLFAPKPLSSELVGCYAKWVRLFNELDE